MFDPNEVQTDAVFHKCLSECQESLNPLSVANMVEVMIQTGCEDPIDRQKLLGKTSAQLVLQYCRDCECNNHFPFAIVDDHGDGTEQPTLILKPTAP